MIRRGRDRPTPDARPAVRAPRFRLAPALAPVLLLSAAALVASALTPARSAHAQQTGLELPVVEDTLGNGMRVLALRRSGAPIVSFVMRFEVGSVNESLGRTGIAHFLEHLLFKGTTTVGTRDLEAERELFPVMDAVHDTLLAVRAGRLEGVAGLEGLEESELRQRITELEDSARGYVVPNELDRLYTEAGARDMNATTSYEGTTYYVRLPSNRTELWFALEADRMANPVLREFYAERDVVAEERRSRLETAPAGRLVEEFYGAAFRVHPYGVPVIGHMSDIQAYTRSQVEAYHRRYYGPNNAVVAVVGDIDPERVMRWARRYFGPIPRGDEPPPVLAVEPEQRGERRVEVLADAEPQLMIGWRIPSGLHDDAPALTVLARILAGGRTSRLYRRLVVDDGLVAGVSAELGPGFRYPRLLTISTQPLSGESPAEVEAIIYEEMERIRSEPPTELELQRVRNQIEVAEIRRLTSGLALAFQIAESAAYHGDWRETFRTSAELAAVTPEDVRRVAERYIRREARTVATLVRPPAAEQAEPEATTETESEPPESEEASSSPAAPAGARP